MGNFGSSSTNPPPNPQLFYHTPTPPPPPPPPHHGGYRHHRYPTLSPPPPLSQVEHQRAVTVSLDVSVKKETLRLEPDEGNFLLLAFSFDAAAPGSITVYFFAQEDAGYNLTATKDNLLQPVTVAFKEGQGQVFKQPCRTGIDVSLFKEPELTKVGEGGIFPVVVKVEAAPSSNQVSEGGHVDAAASNSLVMFAVFEKKDNDEYVVCVVQQILWVNGGRYVLQEIYGLGNMVDRSARDDNSGKECVVCLSEPRDTTVLPCRHLCLCRECAQILRFQTNKCPICRQPIERLLEIEVDSKSNNTHQEAQ